MNPVLVRCAGVALCSALAAGCRGPTDAARVPVVQFEQHTLALSPGDSARLVLMPMKTPGYVPEVVWRTSNARVATVVNGLVRAVAPGTTTITASGAGAGDTAVVTVEMVPIPVIQLREHTALLGVGDTLILGPLPLLPPGYVPTLTWSSSDTLVASVTPAGGFNTRVRGLHAGHAVITAAGAGLNDTCGVTVR